MVNLFVAILINTGFIILLLNANLGKLSWWGEVTNEIPQIKDYVFNGDFEDTNRDWYVKVGLPIITIVIINLFSIIIQAAVKGPIAACKRCCCYRNKIL